MKTVKVQLPWIPIVSSVSATVKALFQRLLITKACALQDIVDISRTALFYFSYHLTRHYHSLLKQCCVVFLRSVMAVPVFLARSVIPSGEQWPRPCLDTHQLLLYQPVTHLTPTSLSLTRSPTLPSINQPCLLKDTLTRISPTLCSKIIGLQRISLIRVS